VPGFRRAGLSTHGVVAEYYIGKGFVGREELQGCF